MTTSLVTKKEPTQPTMTERKLAGLIKRQPNKISYILQIEKLWESYALNRTDESRDKLLNSLKFCIHQKAEAWERKWKNKRLYKEDFQTIFYETAWKLCDDYSHYQEFYFYETLCLAFKRRGIDLTRKLRTKQGRFEVNALPLLEETSQYLPDKRVDIENDVLNRDLIERVLTDESLTEQERGLLQVIYDNPDSSNRDIAILAGLNHHHQVTRSLTKIKGKLNYLFL
ncbi:hypothetical protein [Peribacillus frigoritolerans]|uniref:hypothetical protein n=1 Tax=Peribacillus frigoritolerans TaxID=450367 RepID=UPI0022829349|nr:hypothetical protein [Peribacillus frigoritolerans]MCY8938085.1 hypothetical protein [Peribacillus frigoritolerans]